MSNNDRAWKDNFYNAICFIPPLFLLILVSDIEKSDELNRNVKRGIILFVVYLLIAFILPFLNGLFFLAYAIFTGVFSFKAYKGEEFKISFLENVVDLFDTKK